MSIPLHDGLQNQTLERVLEDILVRFVINAPPEDLASNARVFFLFEEAHWFYLDYIRNINPYLPSLKMKTFSKKLIELFPLIWKGGDPDEGLKEFGNYKQSIPVRGAALFNEGMSKILLIQGVESPNWSFPRGKISKDEDDLKCAVREVKEEIGFDCSKLINEEEYVERTIRGKNYRIYLVKNVPEDYEFKPEVRNEIAKISWKDFKRVGKKSKITPNKYFLVGSMIGPISSWVKKNKGDFNELQLKKDVEVQLKFMLGIGQETKPTIDPGRELLEFIKNSTAQKAAKDEELSNAANLQQHQQQQQQFTYQQQLSNPLPNFGFQPPANFHPNLPFITPFAPPGPMPFINGVPNFPFPQFLAPYPIPQFPQQFPPQQIPQQPQLQQQFQQANDSIPERAPNPENLQRPSQGIRQRNEHESKELLSILNGKKKGNNNARELLDLFNKNKNDTGDVGGTTKKVTLLKRSDEKKDGEEKEGKKDYSKNLLALLQKKEEKEKNDVKEAKKVEKVEESKPKLKILKREDPQVQGKGKEDIKKTKFEQPSSKIQHHHDQSSSAGYDEEGSRYQSPPPSKELLELIKKSKQEAEEEFEIFEDFTDEEEQFYSNHDSTASVRDQDDEIDQDFEPEDFNKIDSEYESDESVINEPIPEIPVEKSKEGENENYKFFEKAKTVQQIKPKQSLTSVAPVAVNPPKKFKLLKRGEELEDIEPKEQNQESKLVPGDTPKEGEEENESEQQFEERKEPKEHSVEEGNKEVEIDDAASGTSTIQFSDDDDDYDDDDDETVDENTPDEVLQTENEEETTPQPVDTKASDSLLKLLHRTKSTEGSNSTIDLKEKPGADSGDAKGGSKGGNELLSLLHGNAKSPKESEYSTPNNDLSLSFSNLLQQESSPVEEGQYQQPPQTQNVKEEPKNHSNYLLDLLKNPKQKESSPVLKSPQTPSNIAVQESNSNSGADLLKILHKKKSPETNQAQPQPNTNTGGVDFLSLMHKNKSPEPQQTHSNTGGADLLNLLHKNKSPEPTQQSPIFQHDRSATGSPANDLLNMLHKKSEPTQSASDQIEDQGSQNEDEAAKNTNSNSGKSANSFLEFLMRK